MYVMCRYVQLLLLWPGSSAAERHSLPGEVDKVLEPDIDNIANAPLKAVQRLSVRGTTSSHFEEPNLSVPKL